MISVLLIVRTKLPPEVKPMDLYNRACDMVSASGSEADLVVVGEPDFMPEGMVVGNQHLCAESFAYVNQRHHASQVLALRAGMQKCCGQGTIVCSALDQMTPATYRALLGGVTYPLKCAGATFIKEPWNLLTPRKGLYGLREYDGPMEFPFSLRQDARVEIGAIPPVTTNDVDSAVMAYSIQLRSAGYFIAGSLSV